MVNFGTPFVSSTFSRVTNSLSRDTLLANLARIQRDLLQTQEEAATGKRITRPSVDPVGATISLHFRARIGRDGQFVRNLGDATGRLALVDQTLGQAQGVVERSRVILLREIQSTADADTRRASALEINALLDEAVDIADTRFENSYLFAGGRQTQRPFTAAGGGIAYLGDDAPPRFNLSDGGAVPVAVTGARVFGGLSDAIAGSTDLDPDINAATKLVALNEGRGVRRGSIALGTGAATLRTIDLRIADDVGDVLNLINAQSGATGVTAAVNAGGNGLVLTSASTVLVQEVDGGRTAQDLGLPNLAAPAASPVAGADLDPALTAATPLALLNGGAGLDLSGLVVTNAAPNQTFAAALGFAGLTTVEDLLNRINHAELFVHAEIKADGTGINLRTRISGARLTVSENGGATAAQLGVLSTIGRAQVADLNNGLGVPVGEGDDITIRRRDGTVFGVDLSAAVTVQDIVDAINGDSDNPPGPAHVDAALGPNNLVLTDPTPGASNFEVRNTGAALTASVLGIQQSVAGAVITGTNLNWAGDQSEGLFTALVRLRDALSTDNRAAIDDAGRLLDRAQERILDARGEVGGTVARFELTQARLEDERDTLKGLLSGVEDADLAEVATRLQLQTTSLQAALAVAARLLQTSLLDFL